MWQRTVRHDHPITGGTVTTPALTHSRTLAALDMIRSFPQAVTALDIETQTDLPPMGGVPCGLDPRNGGITDIALYGEQLKHVFHHEEKAELLIQFGDALKGLSPQPIVTWNGTFFDLPFIYDRAIKHGVYAYLGMAVIARPDMQPKYDYLPGHSVGYDATWDASDGGEHTHLDIAPLFKEWAERHGVKHSLKPVAMALGVDMIEVDRERMHELSENDRQEYALSDVRGTLSLALMVPDLIDAGEIQ